MSVRGDLVARVLLSCVAAYVALLICGLYFGVGGVAHHHVEAGWYWLLAGLVLYTYTSRSNGRHHRANVDGLALRRWTGVGMLGVSGVVYAPSLFIGFLSDDFVLVDLAIHGAFWDFPSPELFRPTPLLLWRGIFEVVGQSPLALHLVNVVIHGLNASLVVAVASRLTNDGVLAFCVGLTFLTLPSNVEAVAWASGVQDVLMTFGCLIFVLCAMGRPSLWVGALAVVALVVGLLAKETAVVAPVLGLLVVDRIRTPRRMVLIGTGAAVCLVYGLWRLTAVTLPSEYAVVPSQYFLKEFLVRPWGTLTVPWSGAMLEAHPSVGVTSGVFVVALLSWATLGRRRVGSGWALSRLALWVTVSVKAPPVFLDTDLGENPMSKEVGEMVRSRDVVQAEGSARTEGARRATGVPADGAAAGAGSLAPGQRWSASRKRDVVLRLLRGESLEALSREAGVEIYRLDAWRERAMAGLELGLKDRHGEPVAEVLDAAKRHIGELSMEIELLRERARAAEQRLPLAMRRSRR